MHTIEEIAALLQIHAQASAHGDALKTIAAAAYSRLLQINSEMSQDSFMDEGTKHDDQSIEPEPAVVEEPPAEAVAPVEPTPEPVTAEDPAPHRRYATPQEEPANAE